jgi:hypothetical protein|tara:strand:- start:4338 stop:4853 length:516 start_codon:yes stop_codon:yes gene_type:complete
MASVGAFNDMMGQFLVELHKTFPDEKSIKKMLTSFDLIKSTSPRLLIDGFMNSVSPYADAISSKDEKFILVNSTEIDFLKELNIIKLWKRMKNGTKEAVWQYLQTLFILGTTIQSVPEDTLSAIEAMAKECSAKMKNEGGEINQDAIMKMMGSMSGMMGNMSGMLGGLPKK